MVNFRANGGPWVQMGYLNPSSTGPVSVTTGFSPSAIEFTAEEHNGSFNSENTVAGGSYVNAEGWATPDEQFTASNSTGSSSTNGHATYVGDGEVLHVKSVNADGAGDNGDLRATVTSFDDNGFTIDFLEVPSSNFYVVWKATA